MEKFGPRRALILHCAQVNFDYMRLPAGNGKFDQVARLYERLALQSLVCAQAWYDHTDCPPHEPAVDGFWWAVVSWALSFGRGLGVDTQEWYRVFVAPHVGFALFLRRAIPEPTWQVRTSRVSELIMLYDARWTELAIKLTMRWGFWHHLRRDWRALFQARRLIQELRRPWSPGRESPSDVYEAYLKSDLEFFRRLFQPFPFSEGTRRLLTQRIEMAEEGL